MKKIKLVIGILVSLSLVIGVLILKDKKEYVYYLAIGDYVSNNQIIEDVNIEGFAFKVGEYLKEDKIVNEINTNYLKNNITSKKLLEMIEKDTYTNKDEGIVKLIEKSKYITITLGINDLINQIKYDSYKNKLVYDKEIITNKIAIFKHNYHKILEEIYDINENAKVLLVGFYPMYGDDELTMEINASINEVAKESNAYYVDVTHIKDKHMYMDNELYLTNNGQEAISCSVIEVIEKLEDMRD